MLDDDAVCQSAIQDIEQARAADDPLNAHAPSLHPSQPEHSTPSVVTPRRENDFYWYCGYRLARTVPRTRSRVAPA